MSYQITFTTAAAREMRKLAHPIRGRLLDAIEALADDPRPSGAKKLVGEQHAWRVRVGDYRVIYDIIDATLTITVVRTAHRREAYRKPG